MNTPIYSRVEALRSWMREHQLDAFVVPSTDPHNSEYPADHWKCREWITGFDGSAGTAIITHDAAALWTDSRYFLQAEQQLEATPFALMRDGLANTPTFVRWLAQQGAGESKPWRVGYVAQALSCAMEQQELSADCLQLVACEDVFALIWEQRPPLPTSSLYVQPLKYAGESTSKKLARIAALGDASWDFYLMNDLSEIAWTLNLRASDIAYNPLFMSYLLLRHEGGAVLFIEESRLNQEVLHYLQQEQVEVRPYEGLEDYVEEFSPKNHRYAYPHTMCVAVRDLLQRVLLKDTGTKEKVQAQLIAQGLPIEVLRAVKNSDEIEGFRQAMRLDGIALVKFRRWLDERISNGRIRKETEHSVAQKLATLRAESSEFRGLSFATIAGYAANGAIVHYEPTATHHAQLDACGLLLLDSGAQYSCGTTDITRTIALGELTEEERRVYTLVLKGHIALSRTRFPEGTTGIQLDLAARYAMWQEGYDFGHGTGHGVGSHLCVHEGPQQIRKNLRACTQQAFLPGMTITNEPGIYVPGEFGVRIENVLLCRRAQETPFGRFLDFEVLTLCPIDTAPIDMAMLDETEREWLNGYHRQVREHLLPLLADVADQQWLISATAEI